MKSGTLQCLYLALAFLSHSVHAQPSEEPSSYRTQLLVEADALLALSVNKPWGIFWPALSAPGSPANDSPTTAPTTPRRRGPEVVAANTTENAQAATALHLAGQATGSGKYSQAAIRASNAIGLAQHSSGMVPAVAVAASGRLAAVNNNTDQYDLLPTARAAAMWLAIVDDIPQPTTTQPADEASTPRRHASRALFYLTKQQARSGAFTVVEPPKASGPRRERKATDPIIRLTTTEYRDVLTVLAIGWAELEQDGLWLPVQRATDMLLKMRLPGAHPASSWAGEYFADGVAVVPPGRNTAVGDPTASSHSAQALLAVVLSSADLAPTPDLAVRATATLRDMTAVDPQSADTQSALLKSLQDLTVLGAADFVKLAGKSRGVRRQFALMVLGLSPDAPGTGRPISRSEARRYLTDNALAIQQRLAEITGDDLASRARRVALLARMAEIERMAE